MDDWLDTCELGDTAPPKNDAPPLPDDRSQPAHVSEAIAQYDAAWLAAKTRHAGPGRPAARRIEA